MILDVNECNGAHGCERSCVNTAGSFHCTCPTGFQLNAVDLKSCDGNMSPIQWKAFVIMHDNFVPLSAKLLLIHCFVLNRHQRMCRRS